MPVSDAARHELYNGLTELLGPERAETLMACLPHYDPADVARRADIDRLEGRLDRVEDELRQFRVEIRADFKDMVGGLGAVNARLDRLFLALVAGLFVVLAAMAGLVATTL